LTQSDTLKMMDYILKVNQKVAISVGN